MRRASLRKTQSFYGAITSRIVVRHSRIWSSCWRSLSLPSPLDYLPIARTVHQNSSQEVACRCCRHMERSFYTLRRSHLYWILSWSVVIALHSNLLTPCWSTLAYQTYSGCTLLSMRHKYLTACQLRQSSVTWVLCRLDTVWCRRLHTFVALGVCATVTFPLNLVQRAL